MKYYFLLLTYVFSGCGSSSKEKSKDIINTDIVPEEKEIITPIDTNVVEKTLPIGAVNGNFISKEVPFYATVKKVDKKKGVTTIGFEKNEIPDIVLVNTYSATLEVLRFPEFESDLLLITTKLKDPIFNKYFLYQLKNGTWKEVVNGFAIHTTNLKDVTTIIKVDPNNPKNMLRHYSVFDLDSTSDSGYTWRLLQESIPILTHN